MQGFQISLWRDLHQQDLGTQREHTKSTTHRCTRDDPLPFLTIALNCKCKLQAIQAPYEASPSKFSACGPFLSLHMTSPKTPSCIMPSRSQTVMYCFCTGNTLMYCPRVTFLDLSKWICQSGQHRAWCTVSKLVLDMTSAQVRRRRRGERRKRRRYPSGSHTWLIKVSAELTRVYLLIASSVNLFAAASLYKSLIYQYRLVYIVIIWCWRTVRSFSSISWLSKTLFNCSPRGLLTSEHCSFIDSCSMQSIGLIIELEVRPVLEGHLNCIRISKPAIPMHHVST